MSQAATAMGRRWSFSIGKVKGTSVRLHVTFLLFLLWVGIAGWFSAGPATALNTVIFIALVFVCVVLHEFGHIFAARLFGVRTPEVVLLPIGGVSRLERIPEEPKAEFVIAIAGPVVSLAIALGLILALGGAPDPKMIWTETGLPALAAQLAYVNLVLFFFNLLPAFPMDGGRILRAGLSAWLGHTRGTHIATGIGQGAAVLLGLAGIFAGNIILVLIAVFIYFAASSEWGIAELQGITAGRPASESMITDFLCLEGNAPVSEAATALIRTEQREFPIIDAKGRLEGLLTRDGIVRALVEGGPDTPIAQVMQGDVPTVSRWTRMDDIVPLLTSGAPAVGVVEDDGRCIGYITWENLMEKLLISRALGRGADRRRHWPSAAR